MAGDATLGQRLGDWTVHESPSVPWMRPLVMPYARVIVTREAADVLARFAWDEVKAGMRADLRRALDEFAASVDAAGRVPPP